MREEVEVRDDQLDRPKSAVIWVNNYHDPNTVQAARADAYRRMCVHQIVKNAVHYRDVDTNAIERVDYCYTNLPHIAREYEEAGIEVIDIDTLTDTEQDKPRRGRPPKAATESQEQVAA